jgi:hypothetical protein
VISPESEEITLEILDDYENRRGPFNDARLPIESVMPELEFADNHERAIFLTFSTSLTYRGDARVVRQQARALWEQNRWVYDPEDLVGNNRYEDLLNLFTNPIIYSDRQGKQRSAKMRYGKKDCGIWYNIAYTLKEDHESNPLSLLSSNNYHAKQIFDYVQTARWDEYAHEQIKWSKKKFPCLGGEKVGPLWLRLIDRYSRSLDGMEQIPLPVDRQIVKVTNFLEGTQFPRDCGEQTREKVRELWHPFCKKHGISTAELDNVLWRIGEDENWDKWGEKYLKQLTD